MRTIRLGATFAFLWFVAILPCVAQTLEGSAAYQELLRRADTSVIVEADGQKYIRAPQTGQLLPGGYGGAFEKKKVRLPNGQEVEVIDPTRRIAIAPQSKSGPELPERVRRIVAELEKLGLHPKVTPLPEAIYGHVVTATVGDMKPGATVAQFFIHVGSEAKVREIQDFTRKHQSFAADDSKGIKVAPHACAANWNGFVVYPVNGRGNSWWTSSVEIGAVSYETGNIHAHCLKKDVLVTVDIKKIDTVPSNRLTTGLAEFAARMMRLLSRQVELAAPIRSQVDNWMKVLLSEIQKLDPEPVSPAVATPATPLSPPAAPEATKPAVVVATPTVRPTARQIFGTGPPPRTLIGPRIERWVNEQRDWAAANPVKAVGTLMMGTGLALLGTFTAPWSGAALIAGGIGAYQSTKPKEPPSELAPIREAREKVQKYQQDWKRGFTDAELNDLGIFMDDLSKLTPEQRMQVCATALLHAIGIGLGLLVGYAGRYSLRIVQACGGAMAVAGVAILSGIL